MSSEPESVATPSPEVLCVSDSRESTARIRNAVASHRPAEGIETTTDPTVVEELAAVWRLDCVVADAEMEPVDGFDIQSAFQTCDRRPSVIVVSVTPDDDTEVVAADTADTGIANRLQQTDEPPGGETAAQVAAITNATNKNGVTRELRERFAAHPAVVDHRIWLETRDGSFERHESEPAQTAVPDIVTRAVETASPQQAAGTAADEPTAAGTAADESETAGAARTVAYPLGETGAAVVELVVRTAAVDAGLRRLTTVAGACLDHQRTVEGLEARFRQTAERNRQLSQFARTVAHDLNSPLSVIYGRIELALVEQSDAELHLQVARNAAKRVDSLITDHLQHIEGEAADADREEVSIQTVAIQAWRVLDPSTARFQVEPKLESVEANPTRLQQLFENLIRNAIEHGSEESIGLGSTDSRDPHAVFDDDTESVTVTIKPTKTGFAVCDDGPGIPPDERESVFESGYTTTDSGSGLGLHIVSEIVDSHGWEISVTESNQGGARFEIDTDGESA